ncbi:phosphoribosylamine-glycine ligase [Colletotrichum sublineola]|nr:phosphoribosylamine-glycine ligase [Colletotrichum sublineola]
MLRILLLGSGGREHALAWHFSQAEFVEAIFVVPGNPGTQDLTPKTSNAVIIFETDNFSPVLSFVKESCINLVVPTQENHLMSGIVDFFLEANVCCFGPSSLSARLEGSKVFSKAFMNRHSIPTAKYEAFDNLADAESWITDHHAATGGRLVIKPSGITNGKGVVICDSPQESLHTLAQLMIHEELGPFADVGPVIIEEFLVGDEFSVAALTDGKSLTILPPFRDYKRLLDFDCGPNTGGMGAECPTPRCSPETLCEIEKTFFGSTINGMAKEGYPYTGFLCIDFIITTQGPKAIEYDCRFGDPETQAVLAVIQSGNGVNLADLIFSFDTRRIHRQIIPSAHMFAVVVVLVSLGYPDRPLLGQRIETHTPSQGAYILYGGMVEAHRSLQVARGRVATICGIGTTLSEARNIVYASIDSMEFEAKTYRRDIGIENGDGHTYSLVPYLG